MKKLLLLIPLILLSACSPKKEAETYICNDGSGITMTMDKCPSLSEKLNKLEEDHKFQTAMYKARHEETLQLTEYKRQEQSLETILETERLKSAMSYNKMVFEAFKDHPEYLKYYKPADLISDGRFQEIPVKDDDYILRCDTHMCPVPSGIHCTSGCLSKHVSNVSLASGAITWAGGPSADTSINSCVAKIVTNSQGHQTVMCE